jgi:putative transposase
MCELTVISERRACRLEGLSRDAFRHEPGPTPATQALSARLIELAQMRHRFGYRRCNGIRHLLIDPGCPTQNDHTESFNGKFRDECLNEQTQ